MRQVQTDLIIFNGATSTGAGRKIFVKDFRHKEVIIYVSDLGATDSVTIKCQGSSSEEAPDFDAAKTIDNEWDYIDMVDQNDGSLVDGDTGVTITGASDLRKFAVNVDGLTWITLNITAMSVPGTNKVSAKMNLYND